MSQKVKIEVPKWLADASNIVFWVGLYLALAWIASLIFRA